MRLYGYLISYNYELIYKYTIEEFDEEIIKEDEKYYYCNNGAHLKYYCNNNSVNKSQIINKTNIANKLFVHCAYDEKESKIKDVYKLKIKTVVKNEYLNILNEYSKKIESTVKKLKNKNGDVLDSISKK